jgi:hypothetical protein
LRERAEKVNSRTKVRLNGVAGVSLAAGLLGAAVALGQGTISTQDGLSLSLGGNGAVASLKIDGVEYASPALPSGFAYRELPASPTDVAPNGSFETGSGAPSSWSWTNNSSGTWTWDTAQHSLGSRSMRVDVPGSANVRSPMLLSSKFAIRPNTPYRFSCRMRTAAVSTALNFFLVERDSAGNLIQRGLSSDSGTSDWTTNDMTIVSGPAAVSAFFKVEIYSGHGTAWIDEIQMLDVFGGHDPEPFAASTISSGGGLVQTASADGLTLTARYTNVGDAIEVAATLVDSTGRDRGVELSFGLPLDIPGWSWEQNPVISRAIAAGTRYENLDTSFGAQGHSLYPFATVRSDQAAVSLAAPMIAQMNRFTYNLDDGFRLTWDLGLSSAAVKTPSRADVKFWMYTQDTRWRFRAAAEKYMTLAPGSFATAAQGPGGAWVIPAGGGSIETVAGSKDFGWGFLEGIHDIGLANANGISVMHYIDPAGYFRLFPGTTTQPKYNQLVAALEQDAATGTGTIGDGIPRREMGQATVNSSPKDPDGRYQVFANSYFWYGNRLQIYPVSPDPDIPAPSMWSVATKYSLDGRIQWAKDGGDHLDGFFLDDLTPTFGAVENHRRDLWAYSDLPLTFSWDTQRVVVLDGFSMAEFCEAFRSEVHDRGLILMGSLTPGVYTWFAPHLDVVGGETRGAESLERAYARRVLGAGRPWSNLFVPSDKLPPDAAEVLAYLRQALLLGFFPGFNGAYWSFPEAYERDRHLFRLYIPLIRTVVAAGWRPVHGVTVSEPAVLVERFDDGRGEVFYLTAQNTGAATAKPDFTLDGGTIGLEDGKVTVLELVHNKALAASRVGPDARFSDTLAPGETVVYRVTAPRPSGPERAPTRRIAPRS